MDEPDPRGQELPKQPEIQGLQIRWCDQHWANLMFAIKDQGLDQFVAPNKELLGQRLADGLDDPCWAAFMNVNMAAIQVFSIKKIIENYNGCSCCAFAHVAEHTVENLASQFIEKIASLI